MLRKTKKVDRKLEGAKPTRSRYQTSNFLLWRFTMIETLGFENALFFLDSFQTFLDDLSLDQGAWPMHHSTIAPQKTIRKAASSLIEKVEYRKFFSCRHVHFLFIAAVINGQGSNPEIKDVTEGSNVQLECRFSPELSRKASTLYWIRTNRKGHDNVAIGETPFQNNYK